MRKFKWIFKIIVAFLIAQFAYTGCYAPHQDTVKAKARKALPQVVKTSQNAEIPEGKLKITLLDINHGDAILLQTKNKNVMVDVGHIKNRDLLDQKLAKYGVKQIDTIIITHHHEDHLGNILYVAGKYKVHNIFDNGMEYSKNPTSVKLHKMLSNGEYHNRVLSAGDNVPLAKGYYFDILAPGDFLNKKLYSNPNNTSIVAKLHYGNFTMMFTGDAENPVEVAVAERYGKELKSDVLKVGHHGSKTSSNWNFVSVVKPQYALISCAEFSKYHHPNKDVVGRLKHLGAKVYTTHDNGDLTILTDGKDFTFENEK